MLDTELGSAETVSNPLSVGNQCNLDPGVVDSSTSLSFSLALSPSVPASTFKHHHLSSAAAPSTLLIWIQRSNACLCPLPALRYTLPSFILASTLDTALPVMYEPGTETEPRCKVPYPQPGAVVTSACHQVDDQVPSR